MSNKTKRDNDKLLSKSGGYFSVRDSSIQSATKSKLKSKTETIISRITEAIDTARGTIPGSIFTFVVSVVGPGCLSLSYALRNVGLIFGIFLVILGALLSYFTLDLLLICAQYLPETLRGPKPGRDISYHTYAFFMSYTLCSSSI